MRLLIAILALTCITAAGVVSLRPWSQARSAATDPGDVLDFGFGLAWPALVGPDPVAGDGIADRARLAADDGRCLANGILATALIARGWCRETGPPPRPLESLLAI